MLKNKLNERRKFKMLNNVLITTIEQFGYFTNCYIVFSETTKECIVIDPGGDLEKIIDKIDKRNLIPTYIALTHGHGDHIFAVNSLKTKYNSIKIIAHEDEFEILKDSSKNYSKYLFENREVNILKLDKFLKDNDIINISSDLTFKVIHTPGHTKGSICYYYLEKDALFTGDTVFLENIGRTDLYSGNFEELINSLKKISALPDNVIIYPGHGPHSTIEYEKNNNHYFNFKF